MLVFVLVFIMLLVMISSVSLMNLSAHVPVSPPTL